MSKLILITQEELTGIIQESLKEALLNFKPVTDDDSKSEIFLTRKEASERLKVSLVTLNSWTKAGLVKSYVIGGRVLYKESELEDSLHEVQTVKY
ncbi:helix-turn-helix domain-containing protein [Cyclobacterium amurskyense]|uniref:helix-turn-helix domain-containing protein n=1 Tax=Cyclobacterium amurskyense TaxID=320787 RepID=UPI0030D99738|tara:strand:- start:3722 stop:4006 length:285 start_codon:yes stop_codon:yes gene_type:complete